MFKLTLSHTVRIRSLLKTLNLWFLTIGLLLLLLVNPAAVQSASFSPREEAPAKIFFILIDKVTWQDINEANIPVIKNQLIEKGAIGLVSNHTALSRTTTGRSYVTISAGNRATAGLGASLALTRDEKFSNLPAQALYEQRYGHSAGQAQVLHLAIPAQVRANLLLNYGAVPALLGEVLAKNKVLTAVYGNADFDNKEKLNREAVLIAADSQGRVPLGDVSHRNNTNLRAAPFGLATNYNYMRQQINKAGQKARFIVIESGDFRRIDAFQKYTSFEVTKKQKLAALKRLDHFLQSLLQKESLSKNIYLLVSPSPPVTAELSRVQQLTPIIIAGKGIKKGSLTSSSTRREAIVTSTDIAPTVLAFFHIATPYQMTGRPMSVMPSKLTPRQLQQANDDFMLADLVASPSIITYIIWQSVALIFALLVTVSRLQQSFFWRRFLQIWLLSALALPLAYLAAPLLPYHSVIGYIGATLFLTITVILVALGLEKILPAGALLATGTLTILFIIINLFAGSPTDLRSVFGYSPIVAGRFYGLGNQTISLLIPAVFVVLALLLDKFNLAAFKHLKILTLTLFLFFIFLIGYPALGANTGGLITAAMVFTVAFLALFYRHVKAWQLVLVFLAAVLFLSLFVLADIYLLPTPTHMGKTALMVFNGGWEQLGIIIKRKALANFRIFKYTSWSYLIVTIMGLLLLQWLTEANKWQVNFLNRHRYLKLSLGVVFIGGLVGALVNDSGISIPALMLGYFTTAVFYLMLGEVGRLKQF